MRRVKDIYDKIRSGVGQEKWRELSADRYLQGTETVEKFFEAIPRVMPFVRKAWLAPCAHGMLSKAGNFLAFQVGWFACVLGRLIITHSSVPSSCPSSSDCISGRCPMRGRFFEPSSGLDCWCHRRQRARLSGILIFRDNLIASWLCPPWLIALWMIFATTFQSSLSWYAGRYWIAAVSGGIFGPVSYYAGQALGALTGGVADGALAPWRSGGVSLSGHVAAFHIQGESSSEDEEESLGGLLEMSF